MCPNIYLFMPSTLCYLNLMDKSFFIVGRSGWFLLPCYTEMLAFNTGSTVFANDFFYGTLDINRLRLNRVMPEQ